MEVNERFSKNFTETNIYNDEDKSYPEWGKT